MTTSLRLTSVNRAATALKAALKKAPNVPTREQLQAAERKARLSTKGKIALSTVQTAAVPGGMEFRVDPNRADMRHVIDTQVAKAKKADVNGDGKLSPKELKV